MSLRGQRRIFLHRCRDTFHFMLLLSFPFQGCLSQRSSNWRPLCKKTQTCFLSRAEHAVPLLCRCSSSPNLGTGIHGNVHRHLWLHPGEKLAGTSCYTDDNPDRPYAQIGQRRQQWNSCMCCSGGGGRDLGERRIHTTLFLKTQRGVCSHGKTIHILCSSWV